jgi:hypothetical protein
VPTLQTRQPYEYTVILGAVFPSLQFVALPFLETRLQQAAAIFAAVVLLATAGLGALLFREQRQDWTKSKMPALWATSLCLGVALSSLLTGAVVAGGTYGPSVGLTYSAIYIMVVLATLAAARRGDLKQSDPASPPTPAIAAAGAVGGAVGPLLALILGKPFFASIAALLHLVAGVVAAVVLSKVMRRASEA